MIIALTGPAGCGKTTLAQALVKQHSFVRARFAGPLKDMLRALGLTEAQVDGDAKEKPSDLLCGKTSRHAMQTLGTEWGRQLIGADVWVNATMRVVDNLIVGHRDVVIDDLRFDNEARALTARDALIVQVSREGTAPSNVHASEQGIAPAWISTRLTNDGTIDEAVQTLRLLAETRRSRGRREL